MRDAGRESPSRKNGVWLKRVLSPLSWFLALVGWWLMLVDSLSLAEVLAGLAVALFAVLLGLNVQHQSQIRFHPHLRWLLWLRYTPQGILHDSALLLVVLWRFFTRRERPQSAFRLVHFPTGGDDPESAARRAFATVATAIAPNTYVIGFDRERGVALIHQLAPAAPDQVRRSVVGTESA